MMGVMDRRIKEKLEAVLVDASTVTEHAEQLRAHSEDHASVLPADFVDNLGVLVEELRDLREDIHDVQLDPTDDTVLPRRGRRDDDRPPARLAELPIRPEDE